LWFARALLTHHVWYVAVVFRADELADLFSRGKIRDRLERPGLREHARVFYRDFLFEMPEVGPAIALDHVQRTGVWVRALVQPHALIETDPIHHERVRFPMPDRVSVPQVRIKFRGMRAAVQVNLMEAGGSRHPR